MKEYKIIHGADLIPFTEQVNISLKEGYILIGGISISHDEFDTLWYAQAVAKPL